MVRFLAGAAACFLMMTAAFLIWQSRAEKRSDLPPPPRMAINQGAAIAAIPPAPEADAKSKEEKRFDRADKNEDGKITLAELVEPRRKPFAKLAGSLWSLVDVAKHCSNAESRFLLIDVARGRLGDFRGSADSSVRSLTMLGLLAKRDIERWPGIEPEATPGRAWVLVRHKLTGNL